MSQDILIEGLNYSILNKLTIIASFASTQVYSYNNLNTFNLTRIINWTILLLLLKNLWTYHCEAMHSATLGNIYKREYIHLTQRETLKENFSHSNKLEKKKRNARATAGSFWSIKELSDFRLLSSMHQSLRLKNSSRKKKEEIWISLFPIQWPYFFCDGVYTIEVESLTWATRDVERDNWHGIVLWPVHLSKLINVKILSKHTIPGVWYVSGWPVAHRNVLDWPRTTNGPHTAGLESFHPHSPV